MSELMTYVQYFYECRKTQLILLFHEQNIPVELLFYNSYESTQLFYDHLFVQNKDRWAYDGYSITREDIMLLNIHMEEHYIETKEELDLLLQERLGENQFVYIWANLDYLPHWIFGKDYLIEGSLHSVLLKDCQITEDKTLYLLQDNYPKYCDYVDSSCIKNAIFMGDREWTRIVTTVHLDPWNFQEMQKALQQKFAAWRQSLVDDFRIYDHIHHMIYQEPADPRAFYKKLEHTLSLISGSRYLFSRFLEFVNASEEMVRRLDECSQIAERMKNAFTKATFRGKINRKKLSKLCDELKHKEIECFQILTSDAFDPSLSIPSLTSGRLVLK
ncbi:hypothetical protein [Paenibacillus sp. IHBB 10380]|uniref:hypothetical protein n=1 Tax=Paenibacillus sp. IHBB 10380 TaxID=1566358 RepID=UPI0005CFCA64|nr:hypothetical protein [Paenibacillus sp. IHBB 10380]AJS60887.1 hypothetical protein UB51_23275 [Paenibacillus sp. IHBB 10380]